MIIKDYAEFTVYIKEGLIRTHDINRYSRILTDYIRGLNVTYTIKIIDKLDAYTLEIKEKVNYKIIRTIFESLDLC